MKYGIIANPVAGKLSLDAKFRILNSVKGILSHYDCAIAGLDTNSRAEFKKCAADIAARADTLIIAGGDGTFHDVINSVSREAVLAYLPLGSGTFLSYSLGYPSSLLKIAKQIMDGKEHSLDLILCDGVEKAISSSIGIDGRVLLEGKKYIQKGMEAFNAHAKVLEKLFREGPEQFDAALNIDGKVLPVKKAVSVIITKVPFYGYGLNVVPRAVFNDGKLHLLTANKLTFVLGLAMSFLGGNRVCDYRTGSGILIDAEKEVCLQMDGEVGRIGARFKFDLLRGELRMRY